MADDSTRPIYVRADGKASYEIVAQVMASLSTSGFTAINLITDTGGPSSGGDKPTRRPREPGRVQARRGLAGGARLAGAARRRGGGRS